MGLPLRYNWRNLMVRKSATLLTLAIVSAIVFVLAWALAFGRGMQDSMNAGGLDDKLIVIKPGATAESTSIITLEEYNLLTQIQGLAVRDDGQVLRSGEICAQASLPRRGGQPNQDAPVAVRGIEEIGFDVHTNVRITEGRRFEKGSDELIVGAAIRERIAGLDIGDEIMLGYLGTRPYKVVGIFEADGGPLESEVWGWLPSLRDAFGRELLSSVALRIKDPRQADEIIKRIKQPPFKLNAKSEPRYYSDIAEKSTQIVYLTLILVVFMGVGACFAVANTIYTSVANRSREIAMLRTIGYSQRAIVAAFIIEAAMVCGVAGLIGLAGAACFQGQRQDFMALDTWSTFAYRMNLTPGILVTALAAALLVAVIGAFVPAYRASRVEIVTALRHG
ncbi:MAG: ABC transporter permease [Planctomycetota bacterium]|nr:ABC transporter permease [Planctomycetota bacterium]